MSRVFDVMTVEPKTIRPDEEVTDAWALMKRHRIRHLPVVDNRRLLGIISRTDVFKALEAVIRDTETGRPIALGAGNDVLVRAYMTSPAETVRPTDRLETVIDRLVTLRIGALPVLDASSHLVGIVSEVDVLRACRSLFARS